MKGQVNIIELIFVILILIAALGVFFPSFVHENRWKGAYLLINSRDLILSMDRMNVLYPYSFDNGALSLFLDATMNSTNLVAWSEVEGTVQGRLVVACNCTESQIDEMNFWYDGLKINGRDVKVLFAQSPLDNIPQEADVLFIRDYKPMSAYLSNFQNYLARGVGIVEMMDFNDPNYVNNDNVQKSIFGLNGINLVNPGASVITDTFSRKPVNSSDIVYGPYKYFYHVPLPIGINSTESVAGCSFNPSGKGLLIFNYINYTFWICNDQSVWFDTNGDGSSDALVYLNNNVIIGGENFTLNYINGNSGIGLSFKPTHTFSDFLCCVPPPGQPDPPDWAPSWGIRRVADIEPLGNPTRTLITAHFLSKDYPAVILNSSSTARVAWVSDLADEPPTGVVESDQRMLLLSLLFWTSNKKSAPLLSQPIRYGYSSSYINVNNLDMYEVYKFTLGLAYPY